MIFYFSGTGNSAWVAQQLARLTGDQAYDIATLAEMPDMQAAKQIGFAFPIYAWGAPEPMVAFAKKLVKPQAFTFGVCTCGAEAGLAMKYFSRIYPLNSSYSLVMPNNYILGSDTDDAETIRIKISTAREEVQRISHEILQQKSVSRVQEGPFADSSPIWPTLGSTSLPEIPNHFMLQAPAMDAACAFKIARHPPSPW